MCLIYEPYKDCFQASVTNSAGSCKPDLLVCFISARFFNTLPVIEMLKDFEKLAGEMKEVRNMQDHAARKERACEHPAC